VRTYRFVDLSRKEISVLENNTPIGVFIPVTTDDPESMNSDYAALLAARVVILDPAP